MLTKELLRFRVVKGKAKPRFVKTGDPMLLGLADRLISAYREKTKGARCEIEETVAPIINSTSDIILSKGLNKLLLDRCEFGHGEDMDNPGLRRCVFGVSGKLLNKGGLDYADFKNEVIAQSKLDPVSMDSNLYGDLPANEKLVSFKDIFPRQLLERYNCSLVQSLLLNAGSLDLVVFDPEAGKMRRMFKYLKFFRLLARIFRENPDDDAPDNKTEAVRIAIDGPISLLENTRKYGLQLASFFPAVCDMKRWELRAEVKLRNRKSMLELDQTSQLVGHYRHFGSYIPEEIGLFHDLFQKESKDWTIAEHTPFSAFDHQELIFPDMTFRNADGKVIHLELFHRWHANQLMRRLELGANKPEIPLLIGVDRFLFNKPEIRKNLDSSVWFETHGFLFREFPLVGMVRKCLDRLVA